MNEKSPVAITIISDRKQSTLIGTRYTEIVHLKLRTYIIRHMMDESHEIRLPCYVSEKRHTKNVSSMKQIGIVFPCEWDIKHTHPRESCVSTTHALRTYK